MGALRQTWVLGTLTTMPDEQYRNQKSLEQQSGSAIKIIYAKGVEEQRKRQKKNFDFCLHVTCLQCEISARVGVIVTQTTNTGKKESATRFGDFERNIFKTFLATRS